MNKVLCLFYIIIRHLLLLEVDQIFVVVENLDVSESSPRVLNLFSSHRIFRLLRYFAAAFLVPAPRPLYLDCSDMVHCESVVLKKSASQWHLVSRLNEPSTKVFHALFFVLGHDVEARGQKLLPQTLSCGKVGHAPVLNRPILVVAHWLVLRRFALFDTKQEQVVRRGLSVHLGVLDVLHVFFEQKSADGGLDLGGCQVLRSHWPRPRFMDNFLITPNKVRQKLCSKLLTLWSLSVFI